MSGQSRPPLSLAYRVRDASLPPPAAERPPLLVLLHGVGSNELAMAALAGSFDPRFVVISARSPIEMGPFSFCWFHVTFTPDGPVIDGDELHDAADRLAVFVDEAVLAFGADPRRVFIAGFSQGGIMGLTSMLTGPDRLAGVVCMSGRLPPEVLPRLAPPDRLRAKPVLIVHGTHDEVLGVEYGRSAHATLERLSLAVTYEEFDMTHTTTDASLASVAEWLTDRLGR